MSVESEAFAYGSSTYGGRPTFALTRRLGDDAGLTLYELVPENLANGRQKRLRRASNKRTLTRVCITDALPDVEKESSGRFDFSTVDAPSDRSPSDWHWGDWCGLKIATLSNSRQRAIHQMVCNVLDNNGVDIHSVTRGEGSVLLSESAGIRLTIAFLSMKRLQKYEKLITAADGIGQMSLEECYYWHAKCRSPANPNGVKALRALLTAHI